MRVSPWLAFASNALLLRNATGRVKKIVLTAQIVDSRPFPLAATVRTYHAS